MSGIYNANSFTWTVSLPWTIDATTHPFRHIVVTQTNGETLSLQRLAIGASFLVTNNTGTPMQLRVNDGNSTTPVGTRVTVTFAYDPASGRVCERDVVNQAAGTVIGVVEQVEYPILTGSLWRDQPVLNPPSDTSGTPVRGFVPTRVAVDSDLGRGIRPLRTKATIRVIQAGAGGNTGFATGAVALPHGATAEALAVSPYGVDYFFRLDPTQIVLVKTE